MNHARPPACSSRTAVALLASILCLNIAAANASVLVTWSDSGSDLVATWSGSFDLTGLSGPSTASASDGASVAFSISSILASSTGFDGVPTGTQLSLYQSTPVQHTAAPFLFSLLDTSNGGGIATGDYFYANSFASTDSNTLKLRANYNSNDPISGTATFYNKSIASVFGSNLATPQVMWTLGNNTVTYAVPEPATYAMLIAGGATALAYRRRRRSLSACRQ